MISSKKPGEGLFLKVALFLPTLTPLLVGLSLGFFHAGMNDLGLCIIAFVLAYTLVSMLGFRWGFESIGEVPVKVIDLAAFDAPFVGSAVSALTVMLFLDVSKLNVLTALASFVVLLFVGYKANVYLVNPFLMLHGYRFYSVKIEPGVQCVLVTKHRVRSPEDIKRASFLTDFLLLDQTEES